MATNKATWLFNGSAAQGDMVFGFSETWYSDLAPAALVPVMKQIALIRAPLLARNTNLFGYRVQDSSGRAYSVVEPAVIGGAARTSYPNVPQDAALCRVFGTAAGTKKLFWVHDLPDDAVSNAQFTGGGGFVGQIRDFINALQAGGFKFQYRDPAAPKAKISSIDVSGNVVLLDPLVLVVGDQVQFMRVRNTNGRTVKGTFKVIGVTDNLHFQVGGYAGGVVAVSGQVRKLSYLYTSLQAVPNAGPFSDPTIRPGIRKCGRPFGQLRGRAPARR